MNKTIVIANQKGGVGKTTTVINLAIALGKLKQKVLLVDFDPQANTCSGLNITPDQGNGIYEMIINKAPVTNIIKKTLYQNIDILPSDQELAGAQVELVNTIARENKLNESLEPVREKYDYILIDTPPSLGLLTLNALVAADSVLIPIQCEYYALEGIAQLLNTIKMIKNDINPRLQIEGVCLTMFDTRTNLSREVMENIVAHFKEKTYKTIIPRNIKLSEAPSYGKPIQDYQPQSLGAQAYNKLAEEFLDKQE
ncbi:MAG TPA: AAA family ATPase [Spirochaetota bacterium]|nr:AAA family ATPase [Spirochaetota bacterium]